MGPESTQGFPLQCSSALSSKWLSLPHSCSPDFGESDSVNSLLPEWPTVSPLSTVLISRMYNISFKVAFLEGLLCTQLWETLKSQLQRTADTRDASKKERPVRVRVTADSDSGRGGKEVTDNLEMSDSWQLEV